MRLRSFGIKTPALQLNLLQNRRFQIKIIEIQRDLLPFETCPLRHQIRPQIAEKIKKFKKSKNL